MHIVQEDLAIFDPPETIVQACLAGPQRLHFSACEGYPGLQALKYAIFKPCVSVTGYYLVCHPVLNITQFWHKINLATYAVLRYTNKLDICAQISAEMVELADTQVSEACAARYGGSTPPLRTIMLRFVQRKPWIININIGI